MLIYWFLPMIFFLGIVTSYEDIRFGKIRNKWIVLALLYGAAIHVLLSALDYIDFGYAAKFSASIAISLFIGFMLWYFNIWTSGDGKLFFAYSFLLPLEVYKINSSNFFQSINILIYAFIPVALLLTINIFIKTNKQEKINYFTKAFEFKQVVRLALFLFSISWTLNLISSYFGAYTNHTIRIFLIFLLFLLMEKVFNKSIVIFLLILSILRLIFDKGLLLFQTWLFLLILLLIFIILRFFLLNISFNVFFKEIKIKELKKGMVPAEIIYREDNIYKKRRILKYGIFWVTYKKPKSRVNLFRVKPEGLSKEEIDKLQKIEPSLPYKTIKIQQTLSFAPFLFLGVVTIIFRYMIL